MEIKAFLRWLEKSQDELVDALKLEIQGVDTSDIDYNLYKKISCFLNKRGKISKKIIKLINKFFKSDFY